MYITRVTLSGVSRRSPGLRFVAWTCLLALLVVAATDWSAQALPPPLETLLGRPEPLVVRVDCTLVPLPPAPDLAPNAGRGPPLS